MPESPSHDSASGLLRIFLAATTWGTIPLFLAQVSSLNPFVIVFWRVAISGTVLLAIALARRDGFAGFRGISRRKLLGLAAQGALLALNWVLFFGGIRLAGVAVAEILGYMGPVFVAVLTPLVLRERFDRRVLVPLALALGGTTVILLSSVNGTPYGPNVPLGAALAAGSSLTYSVLILNSKRLLRGTDSITIMITEDVVASVLLLPAVWLLAGPSTPVQWGSLAVLAVVHTVMTGFLFMSGLRRVRADHGAILTYAEPVSAVVFGALLLHQPITAAVVLGGTAVVAGGVLVARLGTGFGQEAQVAEE